MATFLTRISTTFGLLVAAGVFPAQAHTAEEQKPQTSQHNCGEDESGHEHLANRQHAAQRVSWAAHFLQRPGRTETIKLIGFNDFHGQIAAGKRVAGRPVGSASVLASYFDAARAGFSGRSLIVHAGDHVGASPPESALLQDEPAISFLNLVANRYCKYSTSVDNSRCDVVGTLGNHEFDEGKDELLRLTRGGNHAMGPFLEGRWKGARYANISSNVVYAGTNRTLLPPFVIRKVGNTLVAVIGAVLRETPTIVTPSGVAGLEFLDEAESINRWVRLLRRVGIHTFVVTVHQGGRQNSYPGQTQSDVAPPTGDQLQSIVEKLDDDVDVVISGHAHSFTNALIANQNGKEILVTQAFSAGTAFADIELEIDLRTRDVVRKSAAIVTTYADEGPGLTPDMQVQAMVDDALSLVAPLIEQEVGESSVAVTRDLSAAGESALGNLIADAQRHAMQTDVALMNPGGIRADLNQGVVTWGELFAIQPFGNSLVKITLTGQEIYDVLEQQWLGQPFARVLQISGMTYTWDANAPLGQRIVEVRKDGTPIDRAADYFVTVNSFLASGGDNFTALVQGRDPVGGPVDLDALLDYIEDVLPTPFAAQIEDRIALQ